MSIWESWPLAIGFLQPALLGWLAAAVVPVLIHLWSRRRHRETDWAAMEFLLAAYRPRRVRLFLQELLLLLARVALLVFLVLAAAEPVWEGLPAGAANPRTHRIFIVDASLSMSAEESGTTRFEVAKKAVLRYVDASPEGDGYSLMLAASRPKLVLGGPLFDRQAFREEVQHLLPTDGRVDWGLSLAKCREWIANVRQDRSWPGRIEVILVTDMQRASWPAADAASPSGSVLAVRREARLLAETAGLVVLPISTGEWRNNAAVAELELESGGLTIGEESVWRAVVRRYGPDAPSVVPVQWFIDGKLVRETTLSFDGEKQRETALAYQFETPGEHEVEARITPDALKCDDTRRFVLPVRPAVRVLCVDGRPSNVPFQGAADFLRLALQPEHGEGFRCVSVQVVGKADFDELHLLPFDAVLFCDVAEFTQPEADRLAAFLDRGGGIGFFVGERVRAENYNRVLAAEQGAGRRLLPARLGAIVRREITSLDPLGFEHPMLRAFRGKASVGLLTTPVRAYYRLEKIAVSNAQAVLALDNGDPLIVTETRPGGRVILIATTADTTWTAFPIWSGYVPFVQEMLEYLLQPGRARRNATVGDTIGEKRALKSLQGVVDVEITNPDARRVRQAAAIEHAMLRWSYEDTDRAGYYRGELEPADVVAGEPSCVFAVNPPVEESDPSSWQPEQLANQVLPGVPLQFAASNNQKLESGEIVRDRNRVAQWLLQFSLLLLLLEMGLALRTA